MADINLTIIGLQRVGPAFGLAIKRYQSAPGATHKFTITGYDYEGKLCKEIKKAGALDDCARSVTAAAEGADIIFLDEPLSDIKETLEKIGPVLKSGCVVLEAGPLKQPPIEWAKRCLPESAYLVGLALAINPEHLYYLDADEA
ncbi:MAG: prephenate dehydrogenase/arogenate dehydrogenase family protein, partial [Anaerolineae bacterium]|nr:prephenate dehydrogenase/arogenate dehydrogenase family protein [Anaerolineae bacterium]